MTTRIGPEMLAHLDRKLAAGTITPAQHEARRVEVLELIRRGKDVHVSPARRTITIICSVLTLLLGVFLLFTPTPVALILGVVAIILAVLGFRDALT